MGKYFIWPLLIVLLYAIYAVLPCDSGLFIGGCTLGRIFGGIVLLSDIVVYTIALMVYRFAIIRRPDRIKFWVPMLFGIGSAFLTGLLFWLFPFIPVYLMFGIVDILQH